MALAQPDPTTSLPPSWQVLQARSDQFADFLLYMGILFLAMFVGMLCKYCWDSIDRHGTLLFNIWEILKPIFISGLVFMSTFALVNLSEIEPAKPGQFLFVLFFFFENGFFWEQAYERIRRSHEERNGKETATTA